MARYIIRYDYSDAFSSREQAINFYAENHIQRQNDEVVCILNEQEEKEFIREIEEPLENLSKARLNKLLNLLAVIHRDGGHYVTQHGLNKACEDAKKVILNERSFNKKEFAKE